MEYQYTIKCSVELSKVSDSFDSIIKSLNDVYSQYGVQEQFTTRVNLFALQLRTGRILTTKEKDMVRKIILEEFQKWNLKVESFRRNSRSNSCSKSTQ